MYHQQCDADHLFPATLAVSVNHDNFTNGCIAKTGKFAVSILPENTDPVLIGAFGFQSGKDKDKFAGVDYELAEGIPVVKASMGYMVCKVISTMETSTHTVFLGRSSPPRSTSGLPLL